MRICNDGDENRCGCGSLSNERPKNPIEKRKRNLKNSPNSRGERESDFLVSRFERRKRNSKKDSLLSRRERERDFIFSRFKRRT